MARVTTLALAILLGHVPAQASPDGAAPRELVKRMTDAVVTLLDDAAKTTDERRRGIEQIARDNIDFSTLSRLVLTQWWARLSAPDQKDFVEQFEKHLAVTYGRNFEHSHGETVEVTGDRPEAGGDWTVATRILRPGAESVAIDYRLRKTGADWRVIDVLIEGVSLVSNFRSQFHEILSQGGTARLLQVLREKNAAGEP